MQVSSPYHVRFVSYENFNESQVTGILPTCNISVLSPRGCLALAQELLEVVDMVPALARGRD